jgi:hypothetical protein
MTATLLLDPALATSLTDARLQAHHAAQFATATGISYLPHEADDSHTNLEWIPSVAALASHVVPSRTPFRVAVRIEDLTLLILDARDAPASSFALGGRTIADAATWLRARLNDLGVDGRRYTLTRHYVIPTHPVSAGAKFDGSNRAAFEQLAAWYATAAEELTTIRASNGASEVRCWPHHFDIAVLLEPGAGQSIGIGLEPGDGYYDEPYFYVNMHPAPAPNALPERLDGNGSWHTREWIGAVLPGSRVAAHAGQRTQIRAFLESAIAIARSQLAHTPVGATSP